MRPSHDLQRRLDALLEVKATSSPHPHAQQQPPRPLVCSHVRVGRSATFRRDSKVFTEVRELPALWAFLERYAANGSRVFLATDDYRVRDWARQRLGGAVWHAGGSIVHVEQQAHASDACRGFGDALLDQLILSRCPVLVTCASGFSRLAAYMRGHSRDLFLFEKGEVRKIKL